MIRETIIYFFARGGPALIAFAAVAVYSRLLSPEEYGIYSLTVTGAALLNTLLFYWIRAGLSRFFFLHQDTPTRLFSTLAHAFLKMLLLTIPLSVAAYLTGTVEARFVLLGVALVWGFAAFEISLEVARSRFRPTVYGVLNLLRAVTMLSIGVLLIHQGLGGEAPLVGMVVGMMIVVIFTGWRERKSLRWDSNDQELAKEIRSYAAPLTAIAALSFVISASDRFFLDFLNGRADVGLYSAAYDLTQQALGTLFMVINLAAYPRVVRALDTNSLDEARIELSKNLDLMFWVAVPALVGTIVCAPNIAQVVLGSEYAAHATQIIPWIALASFFGGIKTGYTDLSFHLAKNTRGHLIVSMLAAMTNLVLNGIWIPKFGILGAAYATLVSLFIGLVFSALLGRKVFRLPGPTFGVWKIVFSALLMGVPLWLMREREGWEWLVLQILGGAAFYTILTLLLNFGGIRTTIFARKS